MAREINRFQLSLAHSAVASADCQSPTQNLKHTLVFFFDLFVEKYNIGLSQNL